MSHTKTFGLTHLALKVANIKRTKRFYKSVFGMETMYEESDFLQLTTPGCHDILVFEQHNGLDIGQTGGLQHFGFRLRNAEDIHEFGGKIIDAGGAIIDAGELLPGAPYLFCTDPDGYEIEIWYELEVE